MITGKPFKNFEIYDEHATKDRMIKHIISPSNDLLEQPVCERCERIAIHSQNGTYTCPVCGHVGKKKTTLAEYLVQEMYINSRSARQAGSFDALKSRLKQL